MLQHLEIKNLALLREVQMDFTSGFNVLTGETGAGKSIIVDSLKLALGEKNIRGLVPTNTQKSIVEAVFSIDPDSDIFSMLNELFIDIDDNTVILSREISSNGRSVCRVNGTVVSASQIRSISSGLVDIYGQHDYSSLLQPAKHLSFLDSYAATRFTTLPMLKEEVNSLFNRIKTLFSAYKSIDIDPYERERQLDIIKYQYSEIEAMNLSPGEDEELEDERNKLVAAEEIENELLYVSSVLNEGDRSASNSISQALRHLERITKHESSYQELYNTLSNISYELEDMSRDVVSASYEIVYDAERINEIEERIKSINDLKRKYGNDIESIIAFGQKLEKEIEDLESNSQQVAILNKQINSLLDEYYEKCCELSEQRKKAADLLKLDFEREVSELGMGSTTFQCVFSEMPKREELKDQISKDGLDQLEFYVSTNKGNELKPLAKVLSGGELSRSMLAMKTLCSNSDETDTMIFDEVDSGIGGTTSWIIGNKLKTIAASRQVLCVTHLAQVAANADSHFKVEKNSENDTTETIAKFLSNDERIIEIARMLGGSDKEDLDYAKKLFVQAQGGL